jgi:leucyl-tRNA synthetase
MEYDFRRIEKDWQKKWKESNAYKVENNFAKPKYYVLDMFPYPSGAGLHVGHPLGYIASDIYSRYKRLKGFNVLHPMGFDSFGLPAEQYALDTGQHPAETTKKNIATFKQQLDNIGFCYDWSREVRTSDPQYYKWTQWIFLQLFNSYFCHTEKKALPISLLIKKYETKGAMPKTGEPIPGKHFTAEQWNGFSEKEKADILMNRRLAFCGYGEVNWCEALGTVLANDEVVNGVSERGGHPVVKKTLRQWYLRITEYADRLLEGLNTVDFSEAMKEMQSNWIGKSNGAEIDFRIKKPPLTPPKGEDTTPKYQTAEPSLYSITKMLSEEKRKNPTHEEQLIWQLLRTNKTGFHIRRQHIIGSYIVDFACLDKLVTIEIDGGYHANPEIQLYDKERTAFLNANGFKELRFTNEEVKKGAEAVIKKITEELSKRESVSKKAGSAEVSPSGGDTEGATLRVYTTRPDTIFGVDFMVIAPELDLVNEIKSPGQTAAVDEYLAYVKSRSERERMAEKKISGVFTGAYAINPFSGREIPIWISEYVLAGYGTGAIMAVPCGDERDLKFAKHFTIPVTNIIGSHFNGEEANPTKEAILENSGFLDGLVMKEAMEVAIKAIEEKGIGTRKVNYKMRDAAFSRQRYWGEPFPITWKDGIAKEWTGELPLVLPDVEKYSPGPDGQGPLANIPEWVAQELETNTMPGYAGSSWYFLRYMDPHNTETFCDRTVSDYWNQVDLYIGGTEHAVGHLLYSRMWTKVLYDLGHIGFDEPFKRLVNQGMIQGVSQIAYVQKTEYKENDKEEEMSRGGSNTIFVNGQIASIPEAKLQLFSADVINNDNKDYFKPFNIPIELVELNTVDQLRNELDIKKAIRNYPHRLDAIYISSTGFNYNGNWFAKKGNDWVKDIYNEAGQAFYVESAIEKMSKSKYNVVNPDELCNKYGADTFRMYEMFLGPVEMSKPWDTKGIEGVHRFLKKLWRLFYDELKGKVWNEEKATDAELKVLHNTIKKIESDTERFSFNTGVSGFMIAVNDLSDLKCHKREILEPLLILLTPYAPHIAEELWQQLGNSGTVLDASYPAFEAKYVAESSKEYPISVNGKLRTTMDISLDAAQPEVEKMVLENEVIKKWLEGKAPKKIIFVKGKMVNVVI